MNVYEDVWMVFEEVSDGSVVRKRVVCMLGRNVAMKLCHKRSKF